MPSPSLHRLMFLSLAAAVLTLGLKATAYAVTGSVGLFSDAAEALVNLMAAFTGLISLWYSSRPVDDTHTYGHEKIEYFSSGLEGGLILLAAVGIAWFALERLVKPAPLEALDVGVVISVIAGLINLGAGLYLARVGRARESIIVEAHGRHLLTDVWTTAAVLTGLGLVRLTGLQALDPLMGLAVGALIVWTGFDLIRRSFNGLMDHALPEVEQAAIRAAIRSQLEPGMDFHALRTRQAGAHRFADCHLLVPGLLSVRHAHEVASRIEEAVQAAFPGMEVTVHIEPIEEKEAWNDSALVPLEMASRQAEQEKEIGS